MGGSDWARTHYHSDAALLILATSTQRHGRPPRETPLSWPALIFRARFCSRCQVYGIPNAPHGPSLAKEDSMHGNEHEFCTVCGLGVWLLAMLGSHVVEFRELRPR